MKVPMLPIRQALTSAPPTGGICGRVLPAVGTFLIGSALHRVSLPVSLFKRASSSPRLVSPTTTDCFAPPLGAHPFGAACGWLPRPSVLLTSARIAPGRFASLRSPCGLPAAGYVRCAPIPQVRTQSSATQPPHLPPGLKRTASLCCASSPGPIGVAFGCLRFAPALWGSCSLARGFRIAFLQALGRPHALGLCWCFSFSSFLTQGT